ncbi:MAG TPA: hypothetical protein VHF92_09340 [Geodermatophilus sp.]|nr:hypothetical protein [Geodermatophilus sp.]
MTSSTSVRSDSPYLLQDIQDVLADVLGEFVQEPGRSLRSIVTTVVKEAVIGATIGAFQGLLEGVTSLLRSAGAAVLDHAISLLQRIQRLLLQALEAIRQLVRRLSGRYVDEATSAEIDEVGDPDSEGDMEPAARARIGRS